MDPKGAISIGTSSGAGKAQAVHDYPWLDKNDDKDVKQKQPHPNSIWQAAGAMQF